MLAVDQTVSSPELSYTADLAALSRNASVISTSSSDSDAPNLLRTPRSRPPRAFSSPRSKSPHSTSPRASKPPSYLARELGYEEPVKVAQLDITTLKARSKSRTRSAGVTAEDFQFGATLGEGSYSRVSYSNSALCFACSFALN